MVWLYKLDTNVMNIHLDMVKVHFCKDLLRDLLVTPPKNIKEGGLTKMWVICRTYRRGSLS